jgi:hypothetical protein
MEHVSQRKKDLVGDFLQGAVKGAIYFGLMVGVTAAVFSLFGLGMPFALEPMHLLALTITTGVLNGGIRAYHGSRIEHHIANGNMREAQVMQATPTLIPLIGLGGIDHATAADHALEIEHTPSKRNWAASTERRGDRIQEILQNGAMNDKDRASAILREREERAALPHSLSV